MQLTLSTSLETGSGICYIRNDNLKIWRDCRRELTRKWKSMKKNPNEDILLILMRLQFEKDKKILGGK